MKCLFILYIGIFSTFQSYSQPVTASAADSLYEIGKYFRYNNLDSARYFFQKTTDISTKLNYQKGIANGLTGLGYLAESSREKLKLFLEALEIRSSIHDSIGIGVSLHGIGLIYMGLQMKEKAKDYFEKSLTVRSRIRDYGGIAQTLIDLGKMDQDENDYQGALTKFKKVLVYRKLEGKAQGLAYGMINLSELQFHFNKVDTAFALANKANEYFHDVHDNFGICWSLNLMGECALKQNKYKDSEEYFIMALEINPTYPRTLINLSSLYADLMKFEKAYQMQKRAADAISNSQKSANAEETRKLAADYEFQMKEKEQARQAELDALKINRRNNLQFISISIGVLSLFAMLAAFRRKVSYKLLNALLFLAFLFLFEFLFVLVDPTVSRLSNGQPYIQLLANALLALAVLPVQQLLENQISKKLVLQQKTI